MTKWRARFTRLEYRYHPHRIRGVLRAMRFGRKRLRDRILHSLWEPGF